MNDAIYKEISNTKFFIIVDEAHDESIKEQMTIVLKFVPKKKGGNKGDPTPLPNKAYFFLFNKLTE
jgi:hypothetical protein